MSGRAYQRRFRHLETVYEDLADDDLAIEMGAS
jgi:hypothetical protein